MKKLTLTLIIIFSILAIDLPVMLAYQSSLFSLKLENSEQVNTVEFLKNRAPLTVSYSEDEVSHLQDVKKLMSFASFYFILLLVVEITILIIIFQTDKSQFHKPLLYGGLVSLTVLLITLLWAVIDFNSLFTFFHQTFFPQGNWMFASESKIISLFPLTFFYNLTKEIFTKSIIFSLILTFTGLFVKGFKIRKIHFF